MKNIIYRPERPIKEIVAFLTGLISGIFIGQRNCPKFPWERDDWETANIKQEAPKEETKNKQEDSGL